MTTNEERREAAKRKLEERLEREQQERRRRRIIIASVSTVLVVAVAATVTAIVVKKIHDDREAARWTSCEYQNQADRLKMLPTDPPAGVPAAQRDEYRKYAAAMNKDIAAGIPKKRTAPKPGNRQLKDGKVHVVFDTSQGVIPATLDRTGAACNTGAVLSLIKDKFYDQTPCHRMTTTKGLKVLQCGDPTGTGASGPGWSSPDEPPLNIDMGDGNNQAMTQSITYRRGTIAIANSNQAGQSSNTGSSQFFLVIQDSELPAEYSVVGKVDDAGLKVLDKIYAGGVAPGPMGQSGDGKPKLPVSITSATIQGNDS
ncbi:MAG: peptidylprolyl isomerase [Gordonia sp. (in: high G+C Gram-positive bacteria)]